MRLWVSDETVRLVVLAVAKKPVPETVSAVELAYANCEVSLAKSPVMYHAGVVVALVLVPKVVKRFQFHGLVRVMVPPRATVPPPVRPEPAVTVTLEFSSCPLPMVEEETKLVPSKAMSLPVEKELALVPPEEMPSGVLSVSVPMFAVCENRFVDDAMVEKRFVVVAFENTLLPENVLLSASNVEEAAVTVMLSPRLNVVPFTVPREPVSKFVPILDVATTLPFWSVPRREEVSDVSHVEPELVKAVVLAPPFAEKSPEVIVDDAVEMNPANVLTPATLRVPVAVMFVPMMSPATLSIFHGEVVPMPKYPESVRPARSRLPLFVKTKSGEALC